MQQAVPSADASAGSWTTAPLWSKVDELSGAENDTDFIALANNTTGACRLGPLKHTDGTALTDPGDATSITLRLRAKRTGNKTTTIVVGLYTAASGGTLLCSFSSNMTSSFAPYTYQPTAGEITNIRSNITNLYVNINCTASGTSNAPNVSAFSMDMAAVELKTLTGGLTPGGAITKSIGAIKLGGLTPGGGIVQRTVNKVLSGIQTFLGNLTYAGGSTSEPPENAVLDDFNRANEDPLTATNWGGPFTAGQGHWTIVSNQAKPNSG